jgi:hypothetical protein
MNTLSICITARLIENDCGGNSFIAISLYDYNYLCVAAKKINVFASSDKTIFIEMDMSLYMDLLIKAYKYESKIENERYAFSETNQVQVS